MFIAFTLRSGYQKLWALSRFEAAVTTSCFGLLLLPISLASLFLARRVLPARLLTEAREAAAFRAVVAAEWIRRVQPPRPAQRRLWDLHARSAVAVAPNCNAASVVHRGAR